MMTITRVGGDYLGRDEQVPGGSRSWWVAVWREGTIGRRIGDAVVDDDNDGSDGDLAKIGLEEGGLKRERRKQWFLRKLIQRSITSLKLPGPDASVGGIVIVIFKQRFHVSSSSFHQVLQALSRNACDINVGSTLVTVGAVEANFSHGVAEESHRLI